MSIPSSSTTSTGATIPIDLVSSEKKIASNFRSTKQLTVAKIITTILQRSYGSCFPLVYKLYKNLILELTSHETQIQAKKLGLKKFEQISPQGVKFISANMSKTPVQLLIPNCLKECDHAAKLQGNCLEAQKTYQIAVTANSRALTNLHINKLKLMKRYFFVEACLGLFKMVIAGARGNPLLKYI